MGICNGDKCGGESLEIGVSYGDGYTKATRKVHIRNKQAIVPVEAFCYTGRVRVKLNEVGTYSNSWLGDCNIWADNKQASGKCHFRKKSFSITWRESTVPVTECSSVARGANAGSGCNLDTFKDITCSNYCADSKKKSCGRLGVVPNEQSYGWMKTVPDPCTCPKDSVSNLPASEALCSKYYPVDQVCNSNTFNDIKCSNYCYDHKKERCKGLGGVPNEQRYGWWRTVPDPCTCPKNSAQPQTTCLYDAASKQCNQKAPSTRCDDDDTCLQAKPAWGSSYTCSSSSKYCSSYADDMACCPKTCNKCSSPSTPPGGSTEAPSTRCDDDDTCLQAKPAWGSSYTCSSSSKYCSSYADDMACYPKTCNKCSS